MELLLKRNKSANGCTIGNLFIDGIVECYILEDTIREIPGEPVSVWKIDGETAIPQGKYQIVINFSQRFQKMLPLLMNVPGYQGVRIHGGNSAADTEGCLITGGQVLNGLVVGGTSKPALNHLQNKIQEALDNGEEVWIDIKNP